MVAVDATPSSSLAWRGGVGGAGRKRSERTEEASPVVIVYSDDDSEEAANPRQAVDGKENEVGGEEASMRRGGSSREPASATTQRRRLGYLRGKRAIVDDSDDDRDPSMRAETSGRHEDGENASVIDIMKTFTNKRARSGRGRTDEHARAGEEGGGGGGRTSEDVPGPSSPDVCFMGISDTGPAGQHVASVHAGIARRKRKKEEDVQVLSLKEVIAKEVEKINDESGKGQSSNALTCPVCLGAVKDPLVTKCGHLFCGECIKKSLKVRAEWLCLEA